MREEYDFAKMKGHKNPYAKYLKKQITIRIATDTIKYFKTMSNEVGVPYQNLIDSYLNDCASHKRKLKWA